MTEAPTEPRASLSDPFIERVRWTLYPVVLAVFALPLLPASLVLAILAPRLVAHHGLVINHQPWLRVPLDTLLPSWAGWAAGIALALCLALSWGAAVHLVAEELGGRPMRVRAALRRSVMRLPLTLAAVAVPALVLVAVDTALLQVYDQADPAVRFLVGAAVFCALPPVWAPLVGVHAKDRPLAFASALRGRGLITGAEALGPLAVVAACAGAVVFGALMSTTTSGLVVTALAAVAGLAVSAASLTLAVLGPGPAAQDPAPGRPVLAAVLTGLVLAQVAVPLALYERLITDGPWPILRYEHLSTEPWGDRESNPQPILLPPDGDSVLLGTREVLCERERCAQEETAVDGAGPVLATTGFHRDYLRTVRASLNPDLPQGTIVLSDECLDSEECRDRDRNLEPEVEVAGEWNAEEEDREEQRTTSRLDRQIAAWGGQAGGRDLIVTATPSVGREETFLTLFSCDPLGCRDQATTLLDRLPGSTFANGFYPHLSHPDLISVTADEHGAPRVAVHDPVSGELSLYVCQDQACEDFTRSVPVPSTGAARGPDRAHFTGASMQVRPDGTPVLVYLDTTDGSVRLLDCADTGCAESENVQVMGPAWQRRAPALALDSHGLPQIATVDVTTQEVVYLACADQRCQEVERTAVGVYDRAPGWTDLALDEQDRPHIAWRQVEDEGTGREESIELVRCARAHCEPS
ncbi:hypothetical protein [Nocardiopsis sp. CA-288880]|uniref:hypothetical protein n=1 Tax=Nocardiopsis sp. CA-288880 TaxID=3239995 RepID=UPI003D9609C2